MHNAGMIYGYARVSTDAQDLTIQLAQLKAAGCEKTFREKITGTTADRPQLRKLLAALAPGDVVITPAVDRLSRDATDLLVIARDMQRAGAGLRSIAEPVVDTTPDQAFDCCRQELPRNRWLWAVDRYRRRDPGSHPPAPGDPAKWHGGPAHRYRRSNLRHPDPDLLLLGLNTAHRRRRDFHWHAGRGWLRAQAAPMDEAG